MCSVEYGKVFGENGRVELISGMGYGAPVFCYVDDDGDEGLLCLFSWCTLRDYGPGGVLTGGYTLIVDVGLVLVAHICVFTLISLRSSNIVKGS